jgi:S-adenosylmethionine:tRNA-ribosyltransferase-isomerase (queuine synthetase)
MKIIIYFDKQTGEVWFYVPDNGSEPLPFYIKPRKDEKNDDKDTDEKKKIH